MSIQNTHIFGQQRKVFCSMSLSRHVDYLLKNLSLTLNFIKEDRSTKSILKAATDCTALAAINWQDTTSCCFGQRLFESVCNQSDKHNEFV